MRTVNYGLAFGAGVFGGLTLTVLLTLARLVGMTGMNLSMMMGAMFTQQFSVATWLLGFLVHLVVSGLIGIVYAWIFKLWGPANWWHGLVIAIPHTLIAGLFLLAVPAINPAVPELLPAPGFMGAAYGAPSVVGFIILHLVYGTLVGVIYHGKPVITREGRVIHA
ncbi:MAG: hypothetical protein ACOC95_03160 [Planctomycetota bacterium]